MRYVSSPLLGKSRHVRPSRGTVISRHRPRTRVVAMCLLATFFCLRNANGDLLTDSNDPRSWQGATVGTFAQMVLGKDAPDTRRKIIDLELLDDGLFDLSASFPATLLETFWSLRAGAGRCIGKSRDTAGMGNFSYACGATDLFTAANSIDNLWFQSSGTVGDTVFDLGGPATKAAVFNTIDHGPLPGEAIESTVYLSNDRENWTQAVVERVWLEGFAPNLGILWDGFVFAVGTGTNDTFRYVSIIHGGPGALLDDGDDEINGVVGLDSDFEAIRRVDGRFADQQHGSGQMTAVDGSFLLPTPESLSKLARTDPDAFIDLRTRFSGKGAKFGAALRKTSAAALKRAYKRTGSLSAVRLLLEKPGGVEVLTEADWSDPKLQELLTGVLDSSDISPAPAAAALRQRNSSVGELKRLVSSARRWEKIGAYRLLLELLPRTASDATWLLERLGDKELSNLAHEFGDKLVDRVPEAPSESLVALLRLAEASVHEAVVSALLERVKSKNERTKIVAAQERLIDVFHADRSRHVELIKLLAALKTKASLGALVDGLTDPDARVWQACRNELTFIHRAGMKYGPPDRADAATREEAQRKWRQWLE